MPPERLAALLGRLANALGRRASPRNAPERCEPTRSRRADAPDEPPNASRPTPADERATSPTIGAVLLVGVTVILATATGTHLFGLVGGTQPTFASAAVEFSPGEDRVTVTWLANADAEELKVRLLVGDERRTVLLEEVGDQVVVDREGVTVSSGSVGHWKTPATQHGDRVSVTVVAVQNGERVVVAEKSGRV